MGDTNNETQGIIYKLVVYMGGLMVGVGAKMAELNTQQKLSMKAFILHTTVALALHGLCGDCLIIMVHLIGPFGYHLLLAGLETALFFCFLMLLSQF